MKDAREIEAGERIEEQRKLACQLSQEMPGKIFRVYRVKNGMAWTRYDPEPRVEIDGYKMELKYSYLNGEQI